MRQWVWLFVLILAVGVIVLGNQYKTKQSSIFIVDDTPVAVPETSPTVSIESSESYPEVEPTQLIKDSSELPPQNITDPPKEILEEVEFSDLPEELQQQVQELTSPVDISEIEPSAQGPIPLGRHFQSVPVGVKQPDGTVTVKEY